MFDDPSFRAFHELSSPEKPAPTVRFILDETGGKPLEERRRTWRLPSDVRFWRPGSEVFVAAEEIWKRDSKAKPWEIPERVHRKLAAEDRRRAESREEGLLGIPGTGFLLERLQHRASVSMDFSSIPRLPWKYRILLSPMSAAVDMYTAGHIVMSVFMLLIHLALPVGVIALFWWIFAEEVGNWQVWSMFAIVLSFFSSFRSFCSSSPLRYSGVMP